MGHDMKLDKFYYDENSDESRKEIMLEYVKAVDALTINDEFRLRKQIANYEDKLKNAPKLEQLQEQLAHKIIEQDSLKIQYEKDMKAHDQEMKVVRKQVDRFLKLIEYNPILARAKKTALERLANTK
jgi:septal ring factor EnvC (AmiA/AmiB activator)